MVKIKTKDLRIFGLIWSFIFIVLALSFSKLLFIVAGLFIVVSVALPNSMTGFYKVWVKFGGIIGGIISKVILFVLYFTIFTPVAFVLKLLGKDLLNKKIDKSVDSYWNDREVQPQSMKNQF